MDLVMTGVDESASAAAAVRWAGELAARSGATLLAVSAYQNPYAEMPPDEHDALMAERRAALEDEWIRPAVDAGAEVRTVLRDGDARDAFVDIARAEHVDLVVVGRTEGGGEPGVLHVENVAEYMAHDMARPLAVIPADRSDLPGTIVAGFDDSPASDAAKVWCAEVASTLGASVEAVLLEAVDGAEGLLAEASSRGADLVVVGASKRGGLTHIRAGGLSMSVLHHATLPVVLIPADES